VKNTIQRLYDLGQSIWCDNLSRSMLDRGELDRLIDLGIVGITSNPTIFMKAITGSADYDEKIQALLAQGLDGLDLYEGLVVPDIADAADRLRPVYDRTNGIDGFVSLEVNPRLAYDADATIAEARRLFAELDRPNVFIKVPATREGIPAIEVLIAEGVNVNVTLIFAIEMYERVMRAYIDGLRRLANTGRNISRVASVASFFVSRIDTLVDKKLDALAPSNPHAKKLLGKAAVANAKLAYARFREVFAPHTDFSDLATQGARVQRPLWASTSTKNPAYPTTMYVDELIGPDTVNTLPPQTIDAVLASGRTEVNLTRELDQARRVIESLESLGISMNQVTSELTRDGVDLFAESFGELLANLAAKQEQLSASR
jgi:transaldolase